MILRLFLGFCLHLTQGQARNKWNLIKAKWSLLLCRLLYACLEFFCIFLWFYVCFSVLESFWKEMKENRNWAKMSKTGIFTKKLKFSRQRVGTAVPDFGKPNQNFLFWCRMKWAANRTTS